MSGQQRGNNATMQVKKRVPFSVAGQGRWLPKTLIFEPNDLPPIFRSSMLVYLLSDHEIILPHSSLRAVLRLPITHAIQTSIRHLWPTGDMNTHAFCLMSTSAMPSLSDTVALGNLRKKWAMPSRSSIWARLVPTQAVRVFIRYAVIRDHSNQYGYLHRVPAPNPMYASSISLVGFCHRSGSNLKGEKGQPNPIF